MERKEQQIQPGDPIVVEDFKNKCFVPAVVEKVQDSNKGHTVSLVTVEGTPYSFNTSRMRTEGVYTSIKGVLRFYTMDGWLREMKERTPTPTC